VAPSPFTFSSTRMGDGAVDLGDDGFLDGEQWLVEEDRAQSVRSDPVEDGIVEARAPFTRSTHVAKSPPAPFGVSLVRPWRSFLASPSLPGLPSQFCGPLRFSGLDLLRPPAPVFPTLRHVDRCAPFESTTHGQLDEAVLTGFAPVKRAKLSGELDDELKRQRFVRLWHALLLKYFPDTPLVKEFSSSLDPLKSLGHTLHLSSPATLSVRYSGIQNFVKWSLKHDEEVLFDESHLYKFASAYHSHASSVSSAISALNFVGGISGSNSLLVIAGSKRLLGASNEHLERLPPRRQARAMTPEQISFLESVVSDLERSFWERQVIWVFLVLAALRARLGDLRYVVDHSVDDQLLEVVPRHTKTSRLDKSRLPLSMLGPLRLFSSADWYGTHVKSRLLRDLEFGPWVFCPAGSEKEFLNVPARTSDFSKALQDVLGSLGFVSPQQFSAHSAKASVLTFASASGMTTDERAILGYHRLPKESSSIRSYDRTKQLGPVKVLMSHLEEYRGCETTEVSLSGDGCSCSDSDSSSGEELDDSQALKSSSLILNEARGTLHKSRPGDITRTVCGVVLKSHYREVVGENDAADWHRCRRGCFNETLDDLSDSS
jgi:hypothetical protein